MHARAGYYNLLVQFFEPGHFVLCDLQQYQADPALATAQISFTVFDEFLEDKNITLIRADIVNRALDEEVATKIVKGVLRNYDGRKLATDWVDLFNNKPDEFDFDKFVALQRANWFFDEQSVEEQAE